jgi:hypothetical protein
MTFSEPLSVEQMRQSRKSYSVAYQEFMLNYKKYNYHCFFEGKDDPKYYNFRIKSFVNNFNWYICNGKDYVKEIKKIIEMNYQNIKSMYFIDKDFSNQNSDSNDIYITPCYSIENFYTNEEFIKEVLKTEFVIYESDDDFNRIMDIFKELQKEFHKKTIILNAWLASYNDKLEQNNSQEIKRLNIDDKIEPILKNPVLPELKGIKNLDKINEKLKIDNIFKVDSNLITKEDITKKIEFFENIGKFECFFRGKFELIFIVSFLEKLKQEVTKKNNRSYNLKKRKCDVEFKFNNILSSLTQYAKTPICLINFLKKNK